MPAKKKQTRKRARKPTTKKQAPSREDTTDLQSIHDAAVNADVVGMGGTVLGRTLRPVTLESIVLLKQIDSPLILGKSMEEIPNIFLDCCMFIILQTEDVEESRRLAWDLDALRDAALDLAATVPASEFQTVADSINLILQDATATSVEAKPPKGSKDDDPLGNS